MTYAVFLINVNLVFSGFDELQQPFNIAYFLNLG